MSVTYGKKSREVESVLAMACDGCGKELELAFANGQAEQAKNALRICLSGGYGGFIDDYQDTDLCADCATRLQEQWPILFPKAES